jgi:hypothetical protein
MSTGPLQLDSSADGGNPFCTRRIRPGAMPFLFAAGQSADAMVARLGENAWRGQIVGPHGAGKSSLLAALISAIQQTGRHVLWIELHDGQRRLPGGFRELQQLSPPAVVLIDGYEQLSRWHRFRVRRRCRIGNLGLLVTAHHSVGLPEMFRTSVDLESAWQVVEQLQRGYRPLVTREDLAQRLRQRGQDLREALFDLYDLYHRRNPQS